MVAKFNISNSINICAIFEMKNINATQQHIFNWLDDVQTWSFVLVINFSNKLKLCATKIRLNAKPENVVYHFRATPFTEFTTIKYDKTFRQTQINL